MPCTRHLLAIFPGRVLLIFPETNSLELVRAVAGGDLPLEDIIDLEQEALAETGNIILNGCLATIANILQRTLKVSLPEIVRGNGPDLFGLSGVSKAEDVSCSSTSIFRERARYSRLYRNADGSLVSGGTEKAPARFIERTIGEIPPVSHAAP